MKQFFFNLDKENTLFSHLFLGFHHRGPKGAHKDVDRELGSVCASECRMHTSSSQR